MGEHLPANPERWRPDNDVEICPGQCGKAFTFTRRRHHCRSCGEVYCDSCAPVRRLGSASAARACDQCVATYLASEMEVKLAPMQRERRESLILERKVSASEAEVAARERQLQEQAAASSEQLHAWTKTLADAHQAMVGRLRVEHSELQSTYSAALEAHKVEQEQAAVTASTKVGTLEAEIEGQKAEALRLARRSNAEWEAQLAAVEADRARLQAAQAEHGRVLSVQAAEHHKQLAAAEAVATVAASGHEEAVARLQKVEGETAAKVAALEAKLAAANAERDALQYALTQLRSDLNASTLMTTECQGKFNKDEAASVASQNTASGATDSTLGDTASPELENMKESVKTLEGTVTNSRAARIRRDRMGDLAAQAAAALEEDWLIPSSNSSQFEASAAKPNLVRDTVAKNEMEIDTQTDPERMPQVELEDVTEPELEQSAELATEAESFSGRETNISAITGSDARSTSAFDANNLQDDYDYGESLSSASRCHPPNQLPSNEQLESTESSSMGLTETEAQRRQWAKTLSNELPSRYICVARATIRVGRRLTSRDVGVLEVGERVEVIEQVTLGKRGAAGSVERVRFAKGWVSTVSVADVTILRPETPAEREGVDSESWI